jgi:hypothetical protein
MKTRPALILLSVTVAGLMLGGAAAAISIAVRSPDVQRHEGLPQEAAAQDAGFEIRALDAVFSGTETTVRLRVSGPHDEKARLFIRPGDADIVGFSRNEILGSSWDPPELTLVLPPIDPQGVPAVTFHTLNFQSAEGGSEVRGDWRLPLDLPGDLEQVLRIELLAGGILDLGIATAPLTAIRSTTRTVVTFELPAGIDLLSPPGLSLGKGSFQLPLLLEQKGSQVRASYEATAFGERVVLGAGAFTIRSGESRIIQLALDPPDLERAEAAAGTGHSAAASLDATVLTGDSLLVKGVALGTYAAPDRRSWVAVTFAGNWGADMQFVDGRQRASWRLFSADGMELTPTSVDDNFTKDSSGRVGSGTTVVRWEYKFLDQLRNVTLVSGGELQIIRDIPPTTLAP